MPDYIVVEGPLAGGHLGFGLDWETHDLATIVAEVQRLLSEQGLQIPVIPAGGIFSEPDAVSYLQRGASAVQVATRFAVTSECGLPDDVKQAFFTAEADDVEVNLLSPTGYPMRMLKASPAIGKFTRPRCDSFGYGLDQHGDCSYKTLYESDNAALRAGHEKICLCAMMYGYQVWTCGDTVSRLKETTIHLPDGRYQLPTVASVFHDYQHGDDFVARVPAFATAVA